MGNDITLTILGNKADLARERTVHEEEAVNFASSIGAQHFSVSAKTGQGIDAAVSATARQVLASRKRRGASARPPGTGICSGSLNARYQLQLPRAQGRGRSSSTIPWVVVFVDALYQRECLIMLAFLIVSLG